MRYGLIGERIARVCALFYDITLPNLFVSVDTPTLSDTEYTGLCSRTMCFGGKGRLMDGNSGNLRFYFSEFTLEMQELQKLIDY